MAVYLTNQKQIISEEKENFWPKRVALLTAGGLAPCISSAIAALIEYQTQKSPQTEILCYLNGYRALLTGEILRVSKEMRQNIHKLHYLGGSPIGNSRISLINYEDCLKRGLIKVGDDPYRNASRRLVQDNIDVFHTIGGDGTCTGASVLKQMIEEEFPDYKIQVLCLPKTIDNDIYPISQSLGAHTAAYQGAKFFYNIGSYHSASKRMLIVHEIMGRHCGYLAAETARIYRQMLRESIDIKGYERCRDLHALYIPEIEIDFDLEAERLRDVMDKYGTINIFVSEGAALSSIIRQMEADGQEIERDQSGNVKLSSINIGQYIADYFASRISASRTLVQKSGYYCRAAPADDLDRRLIKKCAQVAVEFALKKRSEGEDIVDSGIVGPRMIENSESDVIDENELLSNVEVIPFSQMRGGKHFDINLPWFVKMLEEIGQTSVLNQSTSSIIDERVQKPLSSTQAVLKRASETSTFTTNNNKRHKQENLEKKQQMFAASLLNRIPTVVNQDVGSVDYVRSEPSFSNSNFVSLNNALQTTSSLEHQQLESLFKIGSGNGSDQIINFQKSSDRCSGLCQILSSLMMACKSISEICRNALISTLHDASDKNSFRNLDMLAHNIIESAVRSTQKVSAMASYASTQPILISNNQNGNNSENISEYCEQENGDFYVVTDPLDGKSNINANVSVGSIFGVYFRYSKREKTDSKQEEICARKGLLQKGSKMVASAYCLYGAATIFVVSVGNQHVFNFTLDDSRKTFVLANTQGLKIPIDGSYYSLNGGFYPEQNQNTRDFVHQCKGKKKILRYVGSMVADIHRTLLKGGIYMYPAREKHPNGKLRLVTEVNPIAWLIEQAGGKSCVLSSNNSSKEEHFQNSPLNLQPKDFDQNVAFAVGSPTLIENLVV